MGKRTSSTEEKGYPRPYLNGATAGSDRGPLFVRVSVESGFSEGLISVVRKLNILAKMARMKKKVFPFL